MKGTNEEQLKVIKYKMAKLGFSPSQAMEMDMDDIEAFIYLQEADYQREWELRMKVLGKLFGGK